MKPTYAILSFCFASFLFLFDSAAVAATVEPYALTVENMTDPIGIDAAAPRLSWKLKAASANAKDLRQTAYQVLVASSAETLAKNIGDLWDSGKVESDRSLNIVYGGEPLGTSMRCFWKVRVWDNQSKEPSAYGKSGRFLMGVMQPGDWKAHWIGLEDFSRSTASLFEEPKWVWAGDAESLEKAPKGKRYFRKEFDLSEFDADADHEYYSSLLLSADDRYEIWLNGEKINETWGQLGEVSYLPLWSVLREFELTGKLRNGKNVLAVAVTNDLEGPTGLLAIFRLTIGGDPMFETPGLVSDSSWICSTHPTEGWNLAAGNFDASGWKPAVEVGPVGCGPWGHLKMNGRESIPRFSKTIDIEKPVRTATLHISGLGFYEAKLNGQKIGRKVLDPIPTRFDRRVLYSSYEIEKMLKKGENTLAVDLGRGWYDVRTVSVWNFDNAPWRDSPRLLAQLEIEYQDGSRETVVSDESWEAESRFGYDCIRQGEIVFGSALPIPGEIEIVSDPAAKISAENMPPTVVAEHLKPLKITQPQKGTYVVDFGQNFSGWMRLSLNKPERVKIRYAERLAADGIIDQKPIDMFFKQGSLRSPELDAGTFQTDVFLPDENRQNQTYEPRFVYHGFRYAEITGLSSPPSPGSVLGCVVQTDFPSAGKFECSNALFNKIQQCTLWSYRSNYANGYPTDCPQREKNGWTGDASLAAEQAMYNWNNTAGYEKWIQDLRDEQRPDGNLPGIVPTTGWGYDWGNGPAWDSAFLIIPWTLYVYQGDIRVLEDNYDGMKKYVDYMSGRAHENGLVDHGLGDWLPTNTVTPVVVTSSGYYYIDTMILARTAELLGKTEDAEKYAALAERIKTAYNKELYKGDGVYANGEQTALSCPVHQGLADPGEYDKIAVRLAEAVAKADNHLDVGILGAKYLFRSLSELGRTDLAYTIANQTTAPSYGAWIERGTTTLWEDWKEGESRNHVMFGDISAWFYQYLAGIRLDPTVSVVGGQTDPAAVAFKKFVIAPQPVPGLDWVKAEHDSPYGPIKSSWTKKGNKFVLNVSIPVNTSATIFLPGEKEGQTLGSGDYRFERYRSRYGR